MILEKCSDTGNLIQAYKLRNQSCNTTQWLDLELEPRIFNSSSPETFLQKVTNKVLKIPKQVI